MDRPTDDPPSEVPDVDPAADDSVSPTVLAAIRDRMHSRRFSTPGDLGHLRVDLGTADDAVVVVDDGDDHCMIGRRVGATTDGCIFCLVGRVSLFAYEQLRDGDTAPVDAFADSHDISLVAVYETDEMVQNIALVRHFRRAAKVPAEYLPGSPFIDFADDDSPTDEDEG